MSVADKTEDFLRTVQSVLGDLNAFEGQLNTGIQNLHVCIEYVVAFPNSRHWPAAITANGIALSLPGIN